MPETASVPFTSGSLSATSGSLCRVAVVWIDWYAYHLARFRGILAASDLGGQVAGVELVGGVGVHAGLNFREQRADEPAIETLMPDASWDEAGQLRLAARLWRHLSRLEPKVVLVPGYYTLPGIVAALWAKVHRSTSVLMTESTAEDHRRSPWRERAKSLVIRALFDWAVTGGSAHVRYLRQLGFREDRIAGFYDVVDNDFFGRRAQELRMRSREGFELPENYFLYIGRMAPEKNVEGLLSSWIDYRRDGGTWSLVLVGDGPSAARLREMAAASEFARDVYFAGHSRSSALPPYYAFANCFVLPSTREPWGLVVNEAMASGLPVVVSSRCGCSEDLVVSGQNGFVFDPSDRGQLTYFLKGMEAMGEVQRRAMGRYSAEIVRRYSPSAFGSQIAHIYRSRTKHV